MIFNLPANLRVSKLLFIFSAILLLPVTNAPAQQDAPNAGDVAIVYEVDLADVRNHYITVTASVPVEADQTEMMMAVWTPGSYLVREYQRNVDSIEVRNDKGEDLEYRKSRKNRWTVETEGIDEFTFSYRLYCNEMTVRTNFVGNMFAMLNGAPTFVTVDGRRNRQHIVRIKMPEGWTRIATSLRSGDRAYEFVGESFDEIVDSPIVAGALSVFPFEVGGVQHQLVNVGDDRFWDGTQAASDLKKIVEQHQLMWGTVPYDRYLFLNVIAEAGGGLEHDNSTLIMSSRSTFRDSRRYTRWLSLCSHEFFHTWNVRRLRPKALVNYDYENETYTRSLWVAEGVTSYYEDMLLARAGIISQGEFVSGIGGTISGVQSTPGRKVQSLTEASYDTWIKFYRPDENSSNTSISYYTKGTVVAFLLDAEIQLRTEGEKSLDDVMRAMFEEYSQSGYTEKDFRRMSSEIAGEDLTEWFERAVDSTEELDFSAANKWFGMSFSADERAQRDARAKARAERTRRRREERAKKKEEEEADDEDSDGEESDNEDSDEEKSGDDKAEDDSAEDAGKDGESTEDEDAEEESDSEKDEQETGIPDPDDARAPDFDPDTPWIGASVSDGNVTRVRQNSPATDAGLNIDDEVIAINGLRIGSSISSQISRMEVGEEFEMIIARRGEIMTLRLTCGPSPRSNWRYGYSSSRSNKQKDRVTEWLSPPEPVKEDLEEEDDSELEDDSDVEIFDI